VFCQKRVCGQIGPIACDTSTLPLFVLVGERGALPCLCRASLPCWRACVVFSILLVYCFSWHSLSYFGASVWLIQHLHVLLLN
jgi:hypothetical protein